MFFNFRRPPQSLVSVSSMNGAYLETRNTVKRALGFRVHDYSFRTRQNKIMFVVDFNGDIMATQAKALTHEITSILFSWKEGDEVLINLTSGGGAAHAYGHAASQLDRLRKVNIPFTVSVNQIAASGGYMMACVANKIIASPFAIIGSIGVVAEFPNFNELLKSIGVSYKTYTAGKYKRTISQMGPITVEGEEKLKSDLNDVYDLFKDHVIAYLPQLDPDIVATGEHWHARKALELGLVDEIKTSEEHIIEHIMTHEVVSVRFNGEPKSWAEKFGVGMASAFTSSLITSITTAVMSFMFEQKYLK